VVLALSPTTLHLLGRHRVGPLASFKGLTVIAQLPREDVHASLESAGIVKNLTLIDEKKWHRVRLRSEAARQRYR